MSRDFQWEIADNSERMIAVLWHPKKINVAEIH